LSSLGTNLWDFREEPLAMRKGPDEERAGRWTNS
jgi:hypothetical protein